MDAEKDSAIKKHKRNMEHVPQYMLEKGYKYPKSWPNQKTKWDREMRGLNAIQLSPIDSSIKLAYIEW